MGGQLRGLTTAVGGQARSPTVQTDFKLHRPDEIFTLPEAAVKPMRENHTSRYQLQRLGGLF